MINPKQILKEGILEAKDNVTIVQQNGIDCSIKEDVVIKSKSFVNVLLNESVKIPTHYSMTLQHRSSFSRRGIFITSGLYDSGFEGQIGCSIYNMSDEDFEIKADERICQAIFWKADPASLYEGKYQKDYTSGEAK